MPLAWKPARLPKPHTQIQTRRGTLRFYLGDCLEVLRSITPGTISVIVTSPRTTSEFGSSALAAAELGIDFVGVETDKTLSGKKPSRA
jgi:hypothetical protein